MSEVTEEITGTKQAMKSYWVIDQVNKDLKSDILEAV
jgi:hypothetical protein